MTAWLARNTRPIAAVMLAAALVIVVVEGLDVVVGSPAAAVAVDADDELGGLASLSGLIKVTLFLAVGVGITFAVRSRMREKDASE